MALINKLTAIADAVREKAQVNIPLSIAKMIETIGIIPSSSEPGIVLTQEPGDYPITEDFTNLGNAIRQKTGGQAALTLDEMPAAIRSITYEDSGTEIEPEVGGITDYKMYLERGISQITYGSYSNSGYSTIHSIYPNGEARIDVPYLYVNGADAELNYPSFVAFDTVSPFLDKDAAKCAAVKTLCVPGIFANAPRLGTTLPNLETVQFMHDAGWGSFSSLVEEIGCDDKVRFNSNTFYNLNSLRSVMFTPQADVRITASAFHTLPSLAQLRFKGEETNAWLHAFAFNDCENLEQITFEPPANGVNTGDFNNLISEFAFYKCPKLSKVNFLWDEAYGPIGVHSYVGSSPLKEWFENETFTGLTYDEERSDYSEQGDRYWWKNHGITVYFNGVISTKYN